MSFYDLLAPHLPLSSQGPFWSTYFSLTPLAANSFALSRFTGTLRPIADQPPATGSVLFAHRSPGYSQHILDALFAHPPSAESLPPVSAFSLRRHLLAASTLNDLVFAQTGRHLASRLLGPEFLYLPSWLGHRASVPTTPQARQALHKRVDGDLFLLRRNHLHATIDPHPAASLARFYNDFYLPTIRLRHGVGPGAVVQSLASLRRQIRNARFLWIHSPQGPIAGGLLQPIHGNLIFRLIGIHHANPAFLKLGALPACYFHAFELASQLGCTTLDFRGTRPSLTDGVLRYKRKWNASLYDSSDLSFETMALHWSRPTPTLHAFLHHYAPIFRHHGQFLSASTAPQRLPLGIAHHFSITADQLPPSPSALLLAHRQ